MSSQQEGPESSGSSTACTAGQLKAQQYKASGNEKFNENNFKGAVIEYRKGLLHDLSNTDLHTNISAAYIHLEKYIQASEHAIYAINLNPSFYKGYLRAAKASHGNGMTRYAMKILKNGLKNVSDPNGNKELAKLLTQYTGYMSLDSNAERELEFQSDENDSEQECNPFSYKKNDGLPPMPPLVLKSSLNCWEPIDGSDLFDKYNDSDYKLSGEDDDTDDEDDDGFDHANKQNCHIEKDNRNVKLDTETSCYSNSPVGMFKKESTTETLPDVENKNTMQYLESKLDYKNEEDFELSTPAEDPAMPMDQSNETFNKRDVNNIKQKKNDSFLETVNPELKMLITEFNDHLKRGSEAFSANNYRKAADCFRLAEERVNNHSEFEMDIRQSQVIRYAYATALINLESYDDIVKGLQAFQKMEAYKSTIPAIYAQMTQAYCKLNRFKAAASPLAELHKVLEDCPIFPTFTWPGTNETIKETTPSGLKKYIAELTVLCNMTHKADAVCRYAHCYKTSTHIIPSELIFNSDPDFIGYVRMTCEDKCCIEYHIPCWKAYKESTASIVGKINDKDLLGHSCFTTDCVNSLGEPSIIVSIDIIGIDRKVKSSNRLDHKTARKTLKKRKFKLDEDKNKEKEKDKPIKLKRIREKKVSEMKKVVVPLDEEEEVLEDEKLLGIDLLKGISARKEAFKHYKANNDSLGNCDWNPTLQCYGIPEEFIKYTNSYFLDNVHNDPVEVRDAKEFLFSYFMTMIKDEGPLKVNEIEEQWKESAGDFCDISIVLPNLKGMRDLLLESTIFCQLEEYICLSGQLEEQYDLVKNDTADVVTFLLNDSITHTEGLAKTDLTDLHHQTCEIDSKLASQSSSDAEYNSNDEESELEGLISDDNENEDENMEEGEPQKFTESLSEISLKTEIASNSNDISFIDILNEMTRVKSNFMKHSEESDITKQDTTAPDNKSFNKKDDEKVMSEIGLPDTSCNLESVEFSYDEQISNEDNTSVSDIVIEDSSDEVKCNKDVVEQNLCTNDPSLVNNSVKNKTVNDDDIIGCNLVCTDSEFTKRIENSQKLLQGKDKQSQCEAVTTNDVELQTSFSDIQDTLSQTKESENFKELNKKLEMLTSDLEREKSEKIKLQTELTEKEFLFNKLNSSIDNMHQAYERALSALKDEKRKSEAEYAKKEVDFQKKEKLQSLNLEKMNNLYANIIAENSKLQKEIGALTTNQEKLQKSLETTKMRFREFEKRTNSQETTLKNKLKKSQKSQLDVIKVFWESQTSMLRRRCVEKISEMQSWFSMCPPEEVEDLPSWGDIRQNTMQWSEISKKVPQIEAIFQANYNELENKIEKGEELDNVSVVILPPLPEEPTPLSLDKIHKEITEKHLKKIGDLTQLVVNQQLEIEKSKEANVKIQQLMNTFQVSAPPRTQSPMTTAFGSLALKYSYPQFGQSSVTNELPSTQGSVKIGNEIKLLHSDVQALLKESSNDTASTPIPFGTFEMSDNPAVSPLSFPNLFNTPPPLLMPPLVPPTHIPPPLSCTPPPAIGVALNMLQTTSAISEKKDLRLDSPVKSECPKTSTSRESTSMPAPTPEKSKKKKKNKSESKDSELKISFGNASSLKTDNSMPDCSADESTTDTGDWNLVLPKSAIVKQAVAAAPVPESRLKNKKRLLDKLQLKFPHSSMKEVDDIVKLVREQNNGSLSGLTFNEIESRVERIVVKRQFNKTTPYGLEKLSSSVWGVIKQQDTMQRSDVQVDDCIICLEFLGSEKTKIECNHEFHTKCLRKWLKEKRVCPLCNNFTTMPDEFPAL